MRQASSRWGGRPALYLPLVLAVLAQAVFVLAMPSRPETVATETSVGAGSGSTVADPGEVPSPTGSGVDGPGGGSGAAPQGVGAGDPGQSPSAGPAGGATAQAGDTSHCRGGRQHDLFFHAPTCAAVFSGDNGGATASGVTEDEILVVSFFEKVDQQTAALYQALGVADPLERIWDFEQAAVEFFNAHYELYGRKVVLRHVEADCPQTPADVDRCRAAARQVIRQEPFLVLYNTVFYPEVFDEFTRAGIVTIGGSHFHGSHYQRQAGLRWDYLPDGSTAARVIGDYYCRRMAGGRATHAGPIIHPSIGPREQVQRKLGIIVQQDETNRRTADELRAFAGACQDEPVMVVTFENDINTAASQSAAITNRLIQDKVTTVVCMCPTGAMTIISPNFSSVRYFPEHLLPGIQWLDNDIMARSFDQEQWRHAFGPSHFPEAVPYAEDEAQRVWAAAGRQGQLQCNSCRFWIWQPMRLLGSMLQAAGPALSPQSFAQGAMAIPPRGGWEESGGDPRIELQMFGPGRFTAVADVREVYWDPDAPSPFDGQPGSYIAANGGRRYRLDQIPRGSLPFPPASS